jgi:putative tryptophan/tyrosine transport system substrate-binding protein
MSTMRRRAFIAILGGAATRPLAAPAQQLAVPVIGFLSSRSQGGSKAYLAAFRSGLADMGFVEGRNLSIAFRWAENRYERLPALASELVGLRVALLVAAGGPPAALAAKAATSEIPIVFTAVGDPVELGLVASLGRPAGNVTGMALFNTSLTAKQVELMKELVPQAKAFAFLVNPASPNERAVKDHVMAAAGTLAVAVHVLAAATESEIDVAVREAKRLDVGALAVWGEPFLDSQRDQIVALTRHMSLPTIFAYREHVDAGGLISYGTNLSDSYRQAGMYCGRILKGEKPADLPVLQPTKFEMAINVKTAKAIGLQLPPLLLARADEVIE